MAVTESELGVAVLISLLSVTGIACKSHDSGDGDGDLDLPPGCDELEIPEVCETYSDHIVECKPSYAGDHDKLAAYCACYVSYDGPKHGVGCKMALDEYYACINLASCETLMNACATERMTASSACGS